MKLKNAALLVLVLTLAYWAIHIAQQGQLPPGALAYLTSAQHFYLIHPIATVIAFCVIRFFCDCFSVPGSCTVGNIISGAVFGFWRGVSIVYPLTIVTALTGYFAASSLRDMKFMRRHQAALESLQARLDGGGFLFLVSLRLNPVLPYGVINPAMGLLRVPLPTFLASLIAGVFFDVVILNSIGANLAFPGEVQPIDTKTALICFLALVGGAALLKFLTKRKA